MDCVSVVVDGSAKIGTNSVVLAGVHIGSNAIVAAGAVISTDVPPGATSAGTPARILKIAQEAK